MRTIGIGGEPATGKTSLINKLMSSKKFKKFKYKKILNYLKSGDTIIFGKYEGSCFDGTDRLSMAVQPVAEQFLIKNKDSSYTIIFEGDRLFNKKFLKFSSGICETIVVVLSASEKVKHSRHKERKDTQPETFLKSRKTKIQNIYKSFQIITLKNETPEDLSTNHKKLIEIMKGKNIKKYIAEGEKYIKEEKSKTGVLKFI